MPDETVKCTDMLTALDHLEDHGLDNHLSRMENYKTIQSVLERKETITLKEIERILAVCVHDLKEDMKYAATIMDIIFVIVTRVKEGFYEPPDLVPSALAVLHIIEIAALTNLESFKLLCFRTLSSFSNETILAITKKESGILKIFELYIHMVEVHSVRSEALKFLNKLLKILPPERKKSLVETGLNVWFSKVVPTTIALFLRVSGSEAAVALECLELLTENIITLEYSHNETWRHIITHLCNSQGYPMVMKKQLQEGNLMWHRIWIVFIRLLKHQITQSLANIGTPINSMLPVVEAAFKLDVPNRCKAFECWNVLIDSFSTETNESNINKRLKLLIIPLKSNNAKAEDTAIAKFKCWWHLIRKFQNKMDKFLDTIIVSFLHFCFGKPNIDKSILVPGQISAKLQKSCMQAMVELLGHVNGCEGCTDLPKLTGKLVNTKHLVDNWGSWIYSLASTIALTANNESGLTNQQLSCLWKSFLMCIAELPENNVRKDLVVEVIAALACMVKDCKSNDKLSDILFNVLIMSFFDEAIKVRHIVKSRQDENDPLYRILKIILEPSLADYFTKGNNKLLVEKLKPMTNLCVHSIYSAPNCLLGWLLRVLSKNDMGLLLWSAFAESISETTCDIAVPVMCSFTLWPFNASNLVTEENIKISANSWCLLYNTLRSKCKDIDKNISVFLFQQKDVDSTNKSRAIIYFKIDILCAILKHNIMDSPECVPVMEREIELFKNLISLIDSYNGYYEQLFPMLIDTIDILTKTISKCNVIYELSALRVIVSIKKLLTLMIPVCCKVSEPTSIEWSNGAKLLLSLGFLFDNAAYTHFASVIVDVLLEYYTTMEKQHSVAIITRTLLTKMLSKIVKTDPLYDKINDALYKRVNGPISILKLDSEQQATNNKKVSEQNEFHTPKPKDVPKRTQKKETSIVNTVVENGEEYVVVKSNWKFNPRKLTENQKEKLQRKREDIPALYQDLSQSQDEFKLVSWKTDSQDTTSDSKSASKTNSKEGAHETASEFLKNLPSSDVVPKILENFLTGNDKESTNNAKEKEIEKSTERVGKVETPSPKSTKSPRMALKDRVFRNVRNLIEKSGTQKENRDISEDLNKTMNVPKTPTQLKSCGSDNVTNSAPPMLSADRPSRVKRKPRKFEDLELLTSKKIRQYATDVQTDSQGELPAPDKSVTSIIEEVPTGTIVIDDSKPDGPNGTSSTNNMKKQEENVQNEIIKTLDVEEKKIPHIDNEIQVEKNANTINKIEEKQEKSSCLVDTAKDNDTSEAVNEKERNKEKLETPKVKSKEASTPKQGPKSKNTDEQKSTSKKSSVKKSRIEKELAIDMVEGHPFLTINSEKRLTRKTLESTNLTRRKGVAEKLNKTKSDTPKTDKKSKEKNKISPGRSIVVEDSQDKKSEPMDESSISDDLPFSDDIIESSQDSTSTSIVTKSSKKTSKRVPVVAIERVKRRQSSEKDINESQSILESAVNGSNANSDKVEIKDDIELPLNKTRVDSSGTQNTEDMDTEPAEIKDSSDVIVIEDVSEPVCVSDETIIGTESQEIAEADTQPNDLKEIMEIDVTPDKISASSAVNIETKTNSEITSEVQVSDKVENDLTVTLSESVCAEIEKVDRPTETEVSSPIIDEAKRKQDFLNNTLEISPIKTMSPDRNKKSPSPETSGDYLVIKLSSPVHSNGEPFEKSGSPEVFTDDKVSPDKRDQSPTRTEVTATTSSPSSSLSLKKNRPQVRAGGRGAQMLGLCVPNKIQAIVNPERSETEELKKSSTPNMQARRNLRILYSTVNDSTDTTPSENDDSENFLKFRKSLPAVDSSPSGPILKRKLADIIDDVTVSPASKRKRVSFQDPPVSTTVSVQKYIEPCGVRSPQNSAHKRLERQLRQHTPVKSPKRLSNVFKLDTVLTKAVESFSEAEVNSTPDDQTLTLDETPVVEIIRASELNDTDPICPELVDCKDPIENIASELSSPAMKSLLVKELEGKIETVGDLAKMTELEVNRLCIKAPKVKVAKKVLMDYASKGVENKECVNITIDAAAFDEPMIEDEVKGIDMEMQTDVRVTTEMEVQTVEISTIMNSSQTDVTPTKNATIQTDESGAKSTADIIKTCLSERPDFVDELTKHLEEPSVVQIAETLTCSAATDLLMKKMTPKDSTTVLNRLLDQQCATSSEEQKKSVQLAFIRDYICKSFAKADLALFCSEVLKTAFDKPA